MNYFILKALYIISLWLVATASWSRELTPRDVIERVFRISSGEGHERTSSQHQDLMSDKERSPDDCTHNLEVLPEYTETIVQSTHERELRHLGPQKHYPICHQEKKIRRLNTEEYEYRPAYYEEIKCVATTRSEELGETDEVCSSLGFSCIQWNKTIHLTRRRYTSECWETMKMVILAGCECMWPVHRLGDMIHHV